VAFVIFNAAVQPFDRTDPIGHALIMAVVVGIAADHTRKVYLLPALKRGSPACRPDLRRRLSYIS
jgi:hypothetical protein